MARPHLSSLAAPESSYGEEQPQLSAPPMPADVIDLDDDEFGKF